MLEKMLRYSRDHVEDFLHLPMEIVIAALELDFEVREGGIILKYPQKDASLSLTVPTSSIDGK
jgi:hypothetical protein